MKEMEKIREQLERLLEEERQAKKDEEIARTLQARILNEEWARRETLEKLQEEQRKMLEEERKKREAFEKLQIDKEKELKGLLSKRLFQVPKSFGKYVLKNGRLRTKPNAIKIRMVKGDFFVTTNRGNESGGGNGKGTEEA